MTKPFQPHPMDGDTKPCPHCHGMLVFNRHYAVLAAGTAYQAGSSGRNRIQYEPAWVCRNGGCDYREMAGDDARDRTIGGARAAARQGRS